MILTLFRDEVINFFHDLISVHPSCLLLQFMLTPAVYSFTRRVPTVCIAKSFRVEEDGQIRAHKAEGSRS